MDDGTIRIGIIGAGAVASSVHLPILTRRSDLYQVAAIADFTIDSANYLADRFGLPSSSRYSSAHDLINSGKVDAVAVLNSGSHCAVVVAALAANLHVFCEKPLAYSSQEMTQIQNALAISTGKLMIGYMKTYDQAVVKAKESIGNTRPRSVDVLVLHPSGESQLATSNVSMKSFPASNELMTEFTRAAKALAIEAIGEEAAVAFGGEYADIILGSIIHEFSVLRALDIHLTHIDYVDRWPITSRSESFIIHGRTDDGVRVGIRWFYLDKYPMYQEEIRWVNENAGHHIIFPSPYILHVPTKLISTNRIGIDHETTIFESYQPSFEIELVAFHALVKTGNQKGDPIADGTEDLGVARLIARKICENENLHFGI
jgi:myo-inositol 2-dehydrogenase/D-chiro-inositol 1-dehydrogenase